MLHYAIYRATSIVTWSCSYSRWGIRASEASRARCARCTCLLCIQCLGPVVSQAILGDVAIHLNLFVDSQGPHIPWCLLRYATLSTLNLHQLTSYLKLHQLTSTHLFSNEHGDKPVQFGSTLLLIHHDHREHRSTKEESRGVTESRFCIPIFSAVL